MPISTISPSSCLSSKCEGVPLCNCENLRLHGKNNEPLHRREHFCIESVYSSGPSVLLNVAIQVQQQHFYSVSETIRVFVRLSSRYYCPYC